MSIVEISEYVIWLAVSFQFKHFVADYLLQNTYMLGKFNVKGWELPLAAHVSMHGVATLIICLAVGVPNEVALFLAGLDVVLHSCVDKAKVEASRGLDPQKDKGFWYLLGADQLAHHLTHYFIILLIVRSLVVNGVLS